MLPRPLPTFASGRKGRCAALFFGFIALAGGARADWRPLGPFGGGAEVVRTLPGAKDHLIAATRTGLLFRSNNGGASWSNLPFPAETAGVLHALEVDPRSGTVWYAGVEGNTRQQSGVYKTTDGGVTWTQLESTKGLPIWSLAFSPSNPDVMAAGAAEGIYLTRDAGATWKLISPEGDPELRPVVSLAFDPVSDRTLYAGTTHLPWRTTDGGATWQSIHTGMIDDSDVFSIAVDPHQPQRVLASACSGAYASHDAAGHWKRLETPAGAFRTYFIAMDPRHLDTVFAGTSSGLLKSLNDGATWRKVSDHAVKSIAFDRFSPARIFFASVDAGLLLSTDGGDTLRESNVGFTNGTFTSLAGAGSTLYVTGLEEVYRTENLALRWEPADSQAPATRGAAPRAATAPEPAGRQMLVVSTIASAPKTVLGAGYHGLFESRDAGRTWQPRKGLPDGVRVRALLPAAGGVVLAGTDHGLFRGDASGMWDRVSATAIDSVLASGPRKIAAVGAGAALVSEDEGLTWRQCASPGEGIAWYGFALSPAGQGAENVALAATSLGLYRSQDGCQSWSPVTRGLEQATTEAVLFHPTRPREAYVAQAGKIFRSMDAGASWWPLVEDGDTSLWPSSLLILPSAPDRLFALVPGRGVFSTTAAPPAAVTQNTLY